MAELVELMKALSDDTRYKLTRMLLQHKYCVRALARKLNISESAVSQHLKILRSVGIIKGEKEGYYTHYCVSRELLKKTAEEIVELAELGELGELDTELT